MLYIVLQQIDWQNINWEELNQTLAGSSLTNVRISCFFSMLPLQIKWAVAKNENIISFSSLNKFVSFIHLSKNIK